MLTLEEDYRPHINPVSINVETLLFLKDAIDEYDLSSVLEFGSGVSTMFWSEYLIDGMVVSIENSRRYRKITASRLNDNAAKTVVKFAPLRIMKLFNCHYISYRINRWLKKEYSGQIFDLVLIDGPPGYLLAREATLLQSLPYIDSNTLIVLDDAERPEEKETVKRWGDFLELTDLQYHKVGKKEIATFRVDPLNRKSRDMAKVKTHSRSNMLKLFLTFHKRNIMHNLWLLKMSLLRREPYPDQKMPDDSISDE